MDMKVNLGNYESASVGIICSQVPSGASAEEIEALLDTGRLVFERMRPRLKEKIAEARSKESM